MSTENVKRLWPRREDLPVGFALAGGFSALLGVGALASGSNGAVGPVTVVCLCSLVVLAGSIVVEPRGVASLAVLGWLFTVGFSATPYAQLRPTGFVAGRAAVVIAASAAAGWMVGRLRRGIPRTAFTLKGMDADTPSLVGEPPTVSVRQFLRAVDRRRQAAGAMLAGVALPLLTVGLVAAREHLTMADTLLVYLLIVVGVTLVGGFWPAIGSAIASSLLVNWYFTPPLHTLAIHRVQDLVSLLLFVVIAICISAVVHIAARRQAEAGRSREEADVLLQLARTVLSGSDAPADILDHLVANLGGQATLLEQVNEVWVVVGRSNASPDGRSARGSGSQSVETVLIRDGLELRVGPRTTTPPYDERLLSGFAAQAASALDRQRLRTQAEQAEMLAAGDRMRTALLAAVSHDLRTPLASVKAAVSSLRQTDIEWSAQDQAELLATIEESADRLGALIENLLDMSRVQTGALRPILRSVAIDEIAPIAVRSLGPSNTFVDLPEDLPMVGTDAGLLERVLANLVANALRFSPPNRPPTLSARLTGDRVEIVVTDHGPGVPPDARATIFEPFQRLGDQPSGTGVGLGLAVAKGFTEAMGGSIHAETTPGGGLTMVVTLRSSPALQPSSPAAKHQ